MSNRVYISCPISVDVGHLQKIEKVLSIMGFPVNYWKSGTPYNEDGIRYCDIHVIILPNLIFKVQISNLPSGTAKELKIAISRNIPIFLGYKTIESEYKIYSTDISGGMIQGIGGTTHHIEKYISKNSLPPKDEEEDELDYKAPKYKVQSPVDVQEHFDKLEFDEGLLLFYKPLK